MPDTQLTETETQQLRKLAGQLNQTSSQTRPDNSYQVCEVSASIKNATICDLKTANKYVRRLSFQVVLKCWNLRYLEDVKTIWFSEWCLFCKSKEWTFTRWLCDIHAWQWQISTYSLLVYYYTDNKSLNDSINSTKMLKEKRLKVDMRIIGKIIEK